MERTRFSVLIENKGEKILIDTSPDLRTQFLREDISSIDAVIFTHIHYDHYSGFGDLYRIIWEDLPVYGVPDVLEYIVEERLYYLPFPEPEEVEPYTVFEFADLEFELVPVHHPPVDCYGVIVRDGDSKVVITSDTSTMINKETKERMMDPDLLIADGFIPADGDYPEFVKSRMGEDGLNFADKHMTYEGSLGLSEELNAVETVLVHLSHYYREEHPELGMDGDRFEV